MEKSCHNHKSCINEVVESVEKLCAEKSINFTDLRKKILKTIFADHKSVKAYDILKKLKEKEISDKPPTIYRALDFFMEHGIIHKIHSTNSYVVCDHFQEDHQCHFLICEKCNLVIECCNAEINKIIALNASAKNFKAREKNIEILGICQNCQ